MINVNMIETILYVENQELSCNFYKKLLRCNPQLDVPGMTEFALSDTFKLGLMPNHGIAKILADKTPHPQEGTAIPRCELYFTTNNIQDEYANALDAGAILISPIIKRNWGADVCYFSDPDGHIIAFSQA